MSSQLPSPTQTTPAPPSVGRQRVSIVTLIALVAAVIFGVMIARTPRPYGDWGTRDFIEYWAAGQVASVSGNPYDPARVLAAEQAVGRADSIPIMMWNPPWLLTLMRPVLQLPFNRSASAWMGANLVMTVAACLLITSGYRRTRIDARDLVPSGIACALSMPLVMTIHLGQVSLLLLFAVAALYWSLRHRHDFAAGAALSLLSIKPHLFFLVVVLVAVMVVREKRWRIAVGAAVATGLLLATLMPSPALANEWWQSFVSPPAGVEPAVSWRTPNLPNVIRELMSRWTGTSPTWPLKVIPAIAIALSLPWLTSRRDSLDEYFPAVLCASVIVAPFGWTFDHVVLALPQVIVLLRAFGDVQRTTHRWVLVAIVIASQCMLVVQAARSGINYLDFWWFPVAMLGVWLLSSAMLRRPWEMSAPVRS